MHYTLPVIKVYRRSSGACALDQDPLSNASRYFHSTKRNHKKMAYAEQKITDYVLSKFAKNQIPWRAEYEVNAPSINLPLRSNGEPYRGVNTIILLMESIESGYTSPCWLTFKQCQAIGGNLKGANGTRIIKFGKGQVEPKSSVDKEKTFAFIKIYSVFNTEQAKNLPDDYVAQRTVAETCQHTLHDLADAIGVKYLHGFDGAAYFPSVDTIRLPNKSAFSSEDAYAATFAHELIHSVGAKKRMDRDLSRDDKRVIGEEELVAELGSCMLLTRLGIPAELDKRVIPYIQSWIAACENDPKYILKASAAAQKAIDYLFEHANVKKDNSEAA